MIAKCSGNKAWMPLFLRFRARYIHWYTARPSTKTAAATLLHAQFKTYEYLHRIRR